MAHLHAAGQFLSRGGVGGRRRARAVCASPRPHEGGAGAGRLARGLRLYGRRTDACASSRMPGRACAPILQLGLFHPLDDHYGLSPLEPRADAARHAQCARRTGTRRCSTIRRGPPAPSSTPAKDGQLTPEQFDRLKDELEESFQGAANAGRPLLLEGGLDWKAMAFSPKDMDFIAAQNVAAREVALAFGVPPMLLGIPGDNTYSNYAEANRSFWRQTVLPLAKRTAEALSGWLAPSFAGSSRARCRSSPRSSSSRPRHDRGLEHRARGLVGAGRRRRFPHRQREARRGRLWRRRGRRPARFGSSRLICERQNTCCNASATPCLSAR